MIFDRMITDNDLNKESLPFNDVLRRKLECIFTGVVSRVNLHLQLTKIIAIYRLL